jgi:hypothetical protein
VTSVAWSPDGWFALSASADGTLRLWALDWELERNHPADWHDGARSHLEAFLTIHTPYATLPPKRFWDLAWGFLGMLWQPAISKSGPPISGCASQAEDEFARALTRCGKPTWTDQDFQLLVERLSRAGYGWLRPEGVRRELEKMAAAWQDPPPLE